MKPSPARTMWPKRKFRPAPNLPCGSYRRRLIYLPKRHPLMPVPFLQIKDGECRAIRRERGPDGLVVYCGKPVVDKKSYCPDHCKSYYVPARKTTSDHPELVR